MSLPNDSGPDDDLPRPVDRVDAGEGDGDDAVSDSSRVQSARPVVPSEAVRPELPTPVTTTELVAEPPTRCLNCDAELPGPFCPACGQRAERLRQPVHLFLRDAAGELFGLDGRVWRTLTALLVKPGRLTLAYLQGRRRRFLTPLRVYLLATLSFFVLLSLIDPAGTIISDSRDSEADSVVVAARLVEIDSSLAHIDSARAVLRAESLRGSAIQARVDAEQRADSVLQADAPERVLSSLTDEERQDLIDDLVEEMRDSLGVPNAEKVLRMRVERGILDALPRDSVIAVADLSAAAAEIVPEVSFTTSGSIPSWIFRSGATRDLARARSSREMTAATARLARSALGQIPTVLFLLLPVYAALVKLLYVRRDWFYTEHLVFALHVHAFAFIAGALMLLVSIPGWWGATMTTFYVAVSASIPLYFLIAQKRVYRQSWRKTIVKAVLLGSVYFMLIATAGILLSLALAALRG